MKRILLLTAAYALACIVAAIIAAMLAFPAISTTVVSRQLAGNIGMFLLVGAFYTFVTAWPGFLCTHWLLWRRSMPTHPLIFAVAGLLTALQALILLETASSGGKFAGMLFVPGLWFIWPTGALTGFLYGMIWRRWPQLHRWLQRPSPEGGTS